MESVNLSILTVHFIICDTCMIGWNFCIAYIWTCFRMESNQRMEQEENWHMRTFFSFLISGWMVNFCSIKLKKKQQAIDHVFHLMHPRVSLLLILAWSGSQFSSSQVLLFRFLPTFIVIQARFPLLLLNLLSKFHRICGPNLQLHEASRS